MKVCEICSSESNVKATKIGLLVCDECIKPIAETHRVFGGKVVKHEKGNRDDNEKGHSKKP